MRRRHYFFSFFFFNDTATTEIYTLSLHDALPICVHLTGVHLIGVHLTGMYLTGVHLTGMHLMGVHLMGLRDIYFMGRSEEHTSELQSQSNLVCRLLLEKKNNIIHYMYNNTQFCGP